VEDDPRREIEALRHRIAHFAAEGREAEREAATWLLAEVIMRGPAGFNPGRRLPARCIPRLRYPVIEATT